MSPVRFDLSKHEQRSIILKPLSPEGFARKSKPTSSFMLLSVSLEDDPTGLQIARWLKSFPPKAIKGVDIEALVLRARGLEDLKNHAELFPGSILGSLPSSAKSEILKSIWGLSRVVTSTKAFASEASISPNPLDEDTGQSLAESIVNSMQDSVANVCDKIEDGILLDPDIDLKVAAEDEVTKLAGVEDAIALRQYLLDSSLIPDKPEIPRSAVVLVATHRPSKERFRYGTVYGKPVVIESFQYTTVEAGSSEPPPNTISQIKKMVTQLSHSKRTSFHILPCIGYFREPHAKRFSVVFAMPGKYTMEELPVALSELFGSRKRVPLGLRIQLAYALATALENFHRIGWVHKELKSGNVRFLRGGGAEPGAIEFAQPWLFGFECSRPEDADSELHPEWRNNACRHPERWGNPTIKFERYHDVYALVCATPLLFSRTGATDAWLPRV